MRGRDADPLNILHEVATAATFVAAVCADQFLPSQVGIDPKVTQHQHQKEALHRLGYLEQAQGELLLGGRLHQPSLPEADLEERDKNKLGLDERLDLGLGTGRNLD